MAARENHRNSVNTKTSLRRRTRAGWIGLAAGSSFNLSYIRIYTIYYTIYFVHGRHILYLITVS